MFIAILRVALLSSALSAALWLSLALFLRSRRREALERKDVPPAARADYIRDNLRAYDRRLWRWSWVALILAPATISALVWYVNFR